MIVARFKKNAPISTLIPTVFRFVNIKNKKNKNFLFDLVSRQYVVTVGAAYKYHVAKLLTSKIDIFSENLNK